MSFKKLSREEKVEREIERVKKNSGMEIASLVRQTECFVRLWYDEDTLEYCEELECDLRNLCQASWEKVEEKKTIVASGHKEPPIDISKLPLGLRKAARKAEKKKEKRLHTFRHYAPGEETPRDRIQRTFEDGIHARLIASTKRIHGNLKNRANRAAAKDSFIEKYGDGLFLRKARSAWTYYALGEHLMKFSVNTASGVNLKLNRKLSRQVAKSGWFDIKPNPENDSYIYPWIIFVCNVREAKKIIQCMGRLHKIYPDGPPIPKIKAKSPRAKKTFRKGPPPKPKKQEGDAE
jgi:hypothetical protein